MRNVHIGHVLCYDNGGESFDRYTAVYPKRKGYWPYIAMSDDPFHPQGFGQHGELRQPPGEHLGALISFEQLPVNCQNAIRIDLGVK